jgi:hypothetical protein
MIRVPPAAFEPGILDPEKHDWLIRDLERFTTQAGIDPKWVWTDHRKWLNNNLLSYLRRCMILAQQNVYGLMFVGTEDLTATMSVMAAVILRNAKNARVMSAQTIVDTVLSGDQPEARVLFCPNFFITEEFGRFDNKKIGALADMLTHRIMRGSQTVIQIDDMAKFKTKFGERITSLVTKSLKPMTTAGDELVGNS